MFRVSSLNRPTVSMEIDIWFVLSGLIASLIEEALSFQLMRLMEKKNKKQN